MPTYNIIRITPKREVDYNNQNHSLYTSLPSDPESWFKEKSESENVFIPAITLLGFEFPPCVSSTVKWTKKKTEKRNKVYEKKEKKQYKKRKKKMKEIIKKKQIKIK